MIKELEFLQFIIQDVERIKEKEWLFPAITAHLMNRFDLDRPKAQEFVAKFLESLP